MKKNILVVLCMIFIAGCGAVPESHIHARVETIMGTFVQIKVVDKDLSTEELSKVVDGIIEEAKALEAKLSIYDAASEINVLNIAKDKVVSSDLWDVLVKAKKIGVTTYGAFDITVAPIMKANGFYVDMPKDIFDKITVDPKSVGWHNVELIGEDKRAKLFNNAWLDLSGLAKGYIVDKLSEALEKQGVDHFLVNAGGDIYCGTTGGEYPWKIGVRRPGQEGVVMVLELTNMAVATSGDYENIITDAKTGEVVSHIINPKTDKPVEEKPSSMTVIAATCAEADGLATGMMVMGREKALELADLTEGVEIVAVELSNGKEKVEYSKGAVKYIVRRTP